MKIKTVIRDSFLVACFAMSPYATAMNLPSNISSYLDANSLSEEEVIPLLDSDGKTFIEYIVPNRAQILTDFSTIAPTPRKQMLLFAAMEFSSSSDYLATLNKACDFMQAHTIDGDVFKLAIVGTPRRLGFLSYNYQKPEVISLVQRARALLPDDARFRAHLSLILSGAQKTTDKQYIEMSEMAEPDILP